MQIRERKTIHSSKISDDILVQQSLGGNQQTFEEILRRYRPALFKLIFTMIGDYDKACDIEQQVYLQLYLSLPTLETRKPLKNWLLQVARNRCIDELRRKKVVHFSDLDISNDEDESAVFYCVPDPHPLPDEIIEHRDLRESLLKAIKSLPPKYRSVVLLRYAAELTFPEIGKALGMPEATAKTYFARAKPLLRASLTL